MPLVVEIRKPANSLDADKFIAIRVNARIPLKIQGAGENQRAGRRKKFQGLAPEVDKSGTLFLDIDKNPHSGYPIQSAALLVIPVPRRDPVVRVGYGSIQTLDYVQHVAQTFPQRRAPRAARRPPDAI